MYRLHYQARTDDYNNEVRIEVADPADADLIGSRLGDYGNAAHAPVLDIDFPAKLVPSASPGHFHLFLDHAMTWRRYKRLLRALKKAGIIEPGYYRMAVKKKESYVRTSHRPKNTPILDPWDPDVILYEDGTSWQRPIRKAPSPILRNGY